VDQHKPVISGWAWQSVERHNFDFALPQRMLRTKQLPLFMGFRVNGDARLTIDVFQSADGE